MAHYLIYDGPGERSPVLHRQRTDQRNTAVFVTSTFQCVFYALTPTDVMMSRWEIKLSDVALPTTTITTRANSLFILNFADYCTRSCVLLLTSPSQRLNVSVVTFRSKSVPHYQRDCIYGGLTFVNVRKTHVCRLNPHTHHRNIYSLQSTLQMVVYSYQE